MTAALPGQIVTQTQEKYLDAYQRLTGSQLENASAARIDQPLRPGECEPRDEQWVHPQP